MDCGKPVEAFRKDSIGCIDQLFHHCPSPDSLQQCSLAQLTSSPALVAGITKLLQWFARGGARTPPQASQWPCSSGWTQDREPTLRICASEPSCALRRGVRDGRPRKEPGRLSFRRVKN